MDRLAGTEAEMDGKRPSTTACACAGMGFEEIARRIKVYLKERGLLGKSR